MTKNMKVAIVLETRDDGTIKTLTATGKELKNFERATRSASVQTKSFGGAIGKMHAAVGAYMGLGFARQLLGEADSIGKVSKKLGISASALQEYRYAAKIAGVETRTFDMATQRFTRRVGEAVKGTGEAKEALKTLGIQLTNNTGVTRKTEDLMLDVADALNGVTDPAERLRLAFKLFDSEGVAMVNMMTDGSAGLKNMRAEAQRLGIVMSDKTIKSAEDATDQFTGLADVFKVNMATGLASALKFMSPVIAGFTEMASSGAFWTTAITAISLTISVKLVGAIRALSMALLPLLANPISLAIIGLGAAFYGLKKGYDAFFGAKKAPELSGISSTIKRLEKEILRGEKILSSGGMYPQLDMYKKQLASALKQKKALFGDAVSGGKGKTSNIDGDKKISPPIIDGGWTNFLEGMTKGFEDFKLLSFNVFDQVSKASLSLAKGFEDSFLQSLKAGEFNFQSFSNTVKSEFNRMLDDIIRAQLRANIIKPIFGAVMGGLGGLFGGATTQGLKWNTPGAGYADGGYIGATAGSARSDGQTIRVSGSEYIVNARATAKHLPLLEQINSGSLKNFANGGHVGGAKANQKNNDNIQVNMIVKDATGGAIKIEKSTPKRRSDGGFDLEILATLVEGFMTKNAGNGESPFQDMIAHNAGLSLNKGSY